MPLGTEVDLGPGHIVLDGDQLTGCARVLLNGVTCKLHHLRTLNI